MELMAYLDDSATDAANPTLVVPTYAADVKQWNRFSNEVEALDHEFQAPPIHSTTFEKARHGHRPYGVCSETKRNDYLNRFIGIMGRRRFEGFGTLLDKKAFDNIGISGVFLLAIRFCCH